MKLEAVIIFIVGYVIFSVLMELFGIGELLKENWKNSGNKLNLSNKKLFENRELLKPDEKSSPLTLSKEELGRHTWALIHSIAASFPMEPTIEDQVALKKFIDSLTVLYPCKNCREHFKSMIAENTIKDRNRIDVANYFCDLHNQVNIRLNKEIFDCKKSFDFWGGDCGCNAP